VKVDSKSLVNNLFDSFVNESNKLQDKISLTKKKGDDIQLSEIINLYFQVSNVTSLAESLKKDNQFENEILEKTLIKINQVEKYIGKEFNMTLHPFLISYLEKMIEISKNSLKNNQMDIASKTKKDIEDQARKFDYLRELMSTREFLQQYNKVLKEKKKS